MSLSLDSSPNAQSQSAFSVQLNEIDGGTSIDSAVSVWMRFGFNMAASESVFNIALPQLSAPAIEQWIASEEFARVHSGEMWSSQSDDFAFFTISLPPTDEFDLAIQVQLAYARLMDAAQAAGFPHALKIWNYFARINDGLGDAERYRQFCVGRSKSGFQKFSDAYPAATAIGSPWPFAPTQVIWLAAKHAGIPIENPRQTSAWDYPRQYGPVAPEFSRAIVLPHATKPLLLISGTASVRGHATIHDDTGAQLEELIENLKALIARANERLQHHRALHQVDTEATPNRIMFDLRRAAVYRVYLRNPADLSRVQNHLQQEFGDAVAINCLHGDVCRRDLKIEIDAVMEAILSA